ncbi:hypothetical protein [Fluviicola taffensis]|uniref:hypothetical protein n=1 Tax=Fluviicola taffensis TaxID=191579 RepID=UPI0031379E4A
MNPLETKGRNGTIAIFLSVLLISIFTITFYHIPADSVDPKKFFQQIIRFVLTLMLFYFLFQGKNWARITLIVLFVLAIAGALISLFLPVPLLAKSPFIVMIIIYSFGAYHFNFSKSFKAFFAYLMRRN